MLKGTHTHEWAVTKVVHFLDKRVPMEHDMLNFFRLLCK